MRKLVLLLSLFLSYSVVIIEEILCIYFMWNIHNVDKSTKHLIWRFVESRILIRLQSKKCDMFLYIRQTDHSFANRYRPLVSADDISSITKDKYSKRYTKWNSLENVLFIDVNINHINVHHFESFTMATMTWLTVTKKTQICSVCRNYNPVLSSFMVYHRDCNKSSTTHATYGAWAAYPSGTHELSPSFSGVRVARFLVFDVLLCRLLFVLFLLAIVLSVLLRFMTSD